MVSPGFEHTNIQYIGHYSHRAEREVAGGIHLELIYPIKTILDLRDMNIT